MRGLLKGLIEWVAQHWLALTVLMLVAVTFVSLRSLDIVLPPNSDKTLHFITYAIVAIPIGLAMPNKWLLMIGSIAVWSGIIELIQPHVGRYGEWADLAANALGLLIGLLIARGVLLLTRTTKTPAS